MKKRAWLILAILAGLILAATPVLSACKKSEPTPPPQTKEIHMLAYKWGYDPGVIVVPKGTLVKLHINVAEHHHEDYENVHPEEEYHHGFGLVSYNLTSYPVNVGLPIGEAEVKFVANQTGEFPFTCTVWCGISEDGKEGHHTMNGKLVVFEGKNPPAGYAETPDGYHYLPRVDEGDHPHEHQENDHHNGESHHKD